MIGLAVAYVIWQHADAARCDGGAAFVARQALPPPAGPATVDVSADGRYVAFVSSARLDAADDNVVDDVYVLDRVTGRVSLESVAADGRASAGSSVHPRLSGDGRYVVYATVGSRLLGTVDDHGPQVVRRDRTTGATIVVSRTAAGRLANGWSGQPDISHDGRYVAFESSATDLVDGRDANGAGADIYLFDAVQGSVRRISVATTGEQPASGQSLSPSIDASGRLVVFASTAPLDGVVPKRAARVPRRVFLRDLRDGRTRRLGTSRDGPAADAASYHPAISADGRRVAFVSAAGDLGDRRRGDRHEHVYLVDLDTGRVRLASRSAAGGAADGNSRQPALSADGRYVVFSSDASNLHCARCGVDRADLNLVSDVYRLDTVTGVAERVSRGAPAHEPWWAASAGASIDGSGRVVAFSSRQAVNDEDLDHDDDLFVDVLAGPDGPLAEARLVPCGEIEVRPDASRQR